MVNKIKISITLVLMSVSLYVYGSNIKTISTSDGLSNNVIFSMHQDHLGHMWIGTSDGLNVWNGHSLEIFDSKDGNNFFAGNTVREIYSDGNSGIWVQTYYGLAYIDVHTRAIQYYDEFAHIQGMTCGSDGVPYIVSQDGALYYFNKESNEFVLTNFRLDGEEYKRMHLYRDDLLFCFVSNGIYVLNISRTDDCSEVQLTQITKIEYDIFFVSSAIEDSKCYLVSKHSKDVMTFDMETHQTHAYSSLKKTPLANETIRSILPYNGGIYVGGSASGVYFIAPDNAKIRTTPIKNGIFVMIKDNLQNIIWIGTEGQGVKNWHISEYNFEEIPYDKLPVKVGMPVRSIFRDKDGKLWCGTKGDGIFTISGLAPYMDLNKSNVRKISTSNSALVNNNVFSIVGSGDGKGIWIGTDGPGLNYYSCTEKEIKVVPGSESLKRVHVIYEQDDNTIWVSTHGLGAFKCEVAGIRSGYPRVIKVEKIEFPQPFNKVGNIFSMYAQNDSLIWFGSRGAGAACINTITGKVNLCDFSTPNSKTFNDIYGMVSTDKMLFATGCGLFAYDCEGETHEIVGQIPQRAIHSVLKGEDGNVWLSTNYGIIRYNENDNRCKIYNQHAGLNILEFSDGASYKDISGDMFFGSNIGLTIIRKNDNFQSDTTLYIPKINIVGTITNNVYSPLDGSLSIPSDDTPQAIAFSVVDNINYADYDFSYRIKGFDDKWMNNSNSNIIHLPTLLPGSYTLEIRYHNKSNSYISQTKSLEIEIIPPIFASRWAKTLYCLIALGIAAYYIRRFREKYYSMKKELEERRLQEGVDPEFMARLLQVINENIADPALSVSFIIDKMCISRRALYRKLENVPNLKPQQLIKKTRMNAAADMLVSTGMTVEEIMFKVGYDNRSTFYTNFKETYGCTPKEYRERERLTKSNN